MSGSPSKLSQSLWWLSLVVNVTAFQVISSHLGNLSWDISMQVISDISLKRKEVTLKVHRYKGERMLSTRDIEANFVTLDAK